MADNDTTTTPRANETDGEATSVWDRLYAAEEHLRYAEMYAANTADEDPPRYSQADLAEFTQRVTDARAACAAPPEQTPQDGQAGQAGRGATPRPPDAFIHRHPEGETQFWEAAIHGSTTDRSDNCWRVDRLVSEDYCTPVWYSTHPTDEPVPAENV